MSKITVDEIGSTEVIVRDMTTKEIEALNVAVIESKNEKELANELKIRRKIILDKLGITEDEAKLLLS